MVALYVALWTVFELDNLQPISNLLNYSKIGEKLISQLIVEDTVEKMDPSINR